MAEIPDVGAVFAAPLKIYTGILGQIGDIIMFTATVRRIRELFPNSEITFAVSSRYQEAGALVAGLPYINRLFVTQFYCEKLTPDRFAAWERGWPVDLRGDDEVEEQRRYDLVLETRPRARRKSWWEFDHLAAELAHRVGVPGPIDLRTDVCIPSDTVIPRDAVGKIVLHNDPAISPAKAWPWEHARQCVRTMGPEEVVLLGGPGPSVPGTMDLRSRTTLAQAAAIIASAKCFVGIESGLICIAGSLSVPTVGLFGTSYVPAYGAVYPQNPNAVYLQAEGSLDQIPPEAVAQWVRHVRTCVEAGVRPLASGRSPSEYPLR